MLRVSEIDAALAMTQSLGQRRYGHFDHDAHAATGPFPPSPRLGSGQLQRGAGAADDKSKPKAPPLEQFADAETGQPLYRQRR